MSAKLTPAAVTRMRTSAAPGTGSGTSVTIRRSCGPFRDVCCRARMTAGTLMELDLLIVCRSINKYLHGASALVKLNLVDRQTNRRPPQMAARGRPRIFDRDTALRKAMDLFWERGYEGTSMK